MRVFAFNFASIRKNYRVNDYINYWIYLCLICRKKKWWRRMKRRRRRNPKQRNALNVSSLMRCWQARARNVVKNKRLSANAAKAISLGISCLEITMIVVQLWKNTTSTSRNTSSHYLKCISLNRHLSQPSRSVNFVIVPTFLPTWRNINASASTDRKHKRLPF